MFSIHRHKIVFLFFLLLVKISYSQSDDTLKVVNFNQLNPRMTTISDSVFVINFWATWCVPCRKELPEFEKINAEFTGYPVKVLLVSLDEVKNLNSVLVPFLIKYNIKSEVVILNDPNSNTWIDKVDATWTGSLPATVIFNKGKSVFYEKEMTSEELRKEINQLLIN